MSTRQIMDRTLCSALLLLAACTQDVSAPTERRRIDRVPALESDAAWSQRASMPVARSHMVAAAIDGKIYIAAGGNVFPNFYNSAAVYAPETDAWTALSSASMARSFGATNNAVVDGVLYAVAGNPVGSCTTFVEGYAIASNTWSIRAPAPRERCGAASFAHDGRVWVLGGVNTSSSLRYLEIDVYDPATNSWSTPASMPAYRGVFAAAVLNNKLYLAGGDVEPPSTCTNGVVAFDFATGTWSSVAPMSTIRCLAGAAVVGGRLYVVGGYDYSGNIHASVESYDPTTDTWRPEPAMSTPRYSPGVAVVDDVLYAIGGYNGVATLSSVEALEATPPDVTPPTITIPPDAIALATSPAGEVVTYPATASDNVGVTSFNCTPASGSLFPIGTTLVVCTASDAAGNTASAGFTVTVKGAAAQMTDLRGTVEGFDIHEGTETSLLAKLEAALNSFESGNNSAACGQLDAMISQINAQTGNKISEPEAATLIAQINRIRAVVGC